MSKEKKNQLVKHHNYITESIYNFKSLELNAFFAIVYRLKEKERKVKFTIKEIKQYFNSKDRSFKLFHDTIKQLQKQNIELKTEKGYKSIMPFPTIDFDLEEKTIEIEFNEVILPYLVDLKEQFTLYPIDEYTKLSNKYSKRIFQLLKQYNSIGHRNFEIDYLKKILVADYSRFYDFERFVLQKAKTEINKYTSLKIDYEKIKSGRSVKSIKFTFYDKTKKSDKNEEKEEIKVKETRKDIIKRSLVTFNVKYIKDLSQAQKGLLNVTLKQNGYNKVR